MKRTKVKGSGRKIGSENIIQRELREQLLFKLVISPQTNEPMNEPTIILVPSNV